ncbi:hypothetical protein [Cardinium endosymbiont of Dermatophagoides farinae]|nr:hypothetical protein [Cardinium endosymbiont of Dermatophagoides farinae]
MTNDHSSQNELNTKGMVNFRPSSKPICDQQFLGEAQSSTAEY